MNSNRSTLEQVWNMLKGMLRWRHQFKCAIDHPGASWCWPFPTLMAEPVKRPFNHQGANCVEGHRPCQEVEANAPVIFATAEEAAETSAAFSEPWNSSQETEGWCNSDMRWDVSLYSKQTDISCNVEDTSREIGMRWTQTADETRSHCFGGPPSSYRSK